MGVGFDLFISVSFGATKTFYPGTWGNVVSFFRLVPSIFLLRHLLDNRRE